MGHQMVTWPLTSRDSQRCCEAVRSAILVTDSLASYVTYLLILLTRYCV